MINFLRKIGFQTNTNFHTHSIPSRINAKINFKIKANDIDSNEINKILVIYTDEEGNLKSFYNIPSLIFIHFNYLDLNQSTIFIIFSNNLHNISLEMDINNNEVDMHKYPIITKIISFDLLDDYLRTHNKK
jgi:hypothetical protein